MAAVIVLVGLLMAPAAPAHANPPRCVDSGHARGCIRWEYLDPGYRAVANGSAKGPYIVNVVTVTYDAGLTEFDMPIQTIEGQAGTKFHRVRTTTPVTGGSGYQFFRAWVRVRNPDTGAVRAFPVTSHPF